MSDAAAGAGSARGGAQATSPGSEPLARIVFAVIVVACFAAFLITQRLKHTPTVVQEFELTPYFSPYPSGHEKQAEISFKLEHAEDATVTIINSGGSTVATLVHEYPLASYRTFSLRWNGHRGTAKRLRRTLSPRGLPVLHAGQRRRPRARRRISSARRPSAPRPGALAAEHHAGGAVSGVAPTVLATRLPSAGALAAGAVVALVVIGVLVLAMRRHRDAFPLLAVFALPFRLPISTGGRTVNLLIPLYLVIAAGTLTYLLPRLGAGPRR